MATAATVAALGLQPAGTRQIAEANANGRADDVAAARRALFWGSLALSVAGGIGFFLLRDFLALQLVADPLRATEIGWLAVGVALTVAAGSQQALLNGLRRIGDLARLQISSGVLATIIGVPALLIWRENGLIVFVLAAPLASFVMGHWYVSRIGRAATGPTPMAALAAHWSTMARLGAAFMISGVVLTLGTLAVRALVQNGLGPEALGQFEAAWLISMGYLGIVLGAMGADYYPRLSAAIRDPVAATRLVNEQTEVALLLAGPMVLVALALAPLVIRLLYTAEFDVAADILRWQLLGDILKVASWPLGFILLASGAGKTFIITESTGMGVFILGTWIGLPLIGVTATGLSFVALYVCYLPLVYWLARRRIGFRWSQTVVQLMLILAGAAVCIAALARASEALAIAAGVSASLAFGLYGLSRLGTMADLHGPVGRLSGMSRVVMKKLGVRDE
jgi:PST family polysaccharide transporter